MLRQYRQAASPSAQSRVIGDSNGDPEHIGDRTTQAFRLTQRLVEHQAKREARLDGDRRMDWLVTSYSGRWRMPCGDGVLGEPYCKASPPNQRGIVFWPVRDPVSGPGDLVAVALIELVRNEFPQRTAWMDGLSHGPASGLAIHPSPLTERFRTRIARTQIRPQPAVYRCTNADQRQCDDHLAQPCFGYRQLEHPFGFGGRRQKGSSNAKRALSVC
jgi:hypothetical protein